MSQSVLTEQPIKAADTKPPSHKPQVIADDFMVYIHIYVNITIPLVISALGVVTNFFNMVIFLKLGLKDSMSVGLLALSLTDLLVTSTQLAVSICYSIELAYPTNPVDFWFLGYFYFAWAFIFFFEISCWITAMISVERCFCVVSPFKVKQIFTRSRCLTFILTVYLIHITIHIPIYVTNEYTVLGKVVLLTNIASIETSIIDATKQFNQAEPLLIKTVIDLTVNQGLQLICQMIVGVSALWMGYSLRASSKCRTAPPTAETRLSSQKLQSASSKPGPALSSRERRLVMVVLALAVTLVLLNLPKIITGCLYYLDSEYNSPPQKNLGTLMLSVMTTCCTINCSINFLWYLGFNTNYRAALNCLGKTT